MLNVKSWTCLHGEYLLQRMNCNVPSTSTARKQVLVKIAPVDMDIILTSVKLCETNARGLRDILATYCGYTRTCKILFSDGFSIFVFSKLF